MTARGNERRAIFKGILVEKEAYLLELALKNQLYLGSEQFVERAQARIDPDQLLQEVPRQKRPVAKPLSVFAARYAERDQAMAAAYRTGAYSMQAIADHFGVGRMTVSRAVKRAEARNPE